MKYTRVDETQEYMEEEIKGGRKYWDSLWKGRICKLTNFRVEEEQHRTTHYSQLIDSCILKDSGGDRES